MTDAEAELLITRIRELKAAHYARTNTSLTRVSDISRALEEGLPSRESTDN